MNRNRDIKKAVDLQNLVKQSKLKNGALSGTRTHATGFGDLYSIQLSYERLFWIAHIITKKTVR